MSFRRLFRQQKGRFMSREHWCQAIILILLLYLSSVGFRKTQITSHDAWGLNCHQYLYIISERLSLTAPLKGDTYQGTEHWLALPSPPSLLLSGLPRPLGALAAWSKPYAHWYAGFFVSDTSHSYFAVTRRRIRRAFDGIVGGSH